MNSRLLLWFGLATGVAPRTDAVAQSTRDSAGVRIVENTRAQLARAWRVEPRPMLDIGGVSGDSLYEFNLVMGVAKLNDGRVAVANQGSNTIRFFDATGRFVSFAGRKGKGPGEFEQILSMWRLAGDTLAVGDLHEVEYFTGGGKHARRGAARGTSATYTYPAAFLPSGEYVGFNWNDFDRNAPPDADVTTLPLVRVSADGARSVALGRLPARIGSPMGGVHFAPQARVAASDRTIWYSFGQRHEVRRLSLGGQVEMIARRNVSLRPVTEVMKQEYRQFILNGNGEDGRPWSASMRQRMDAALARATYAAHLPVTSTIRTDAAGNLWVRIYDYREGLIPPGPVHVRTIRVPSEWDVLDPQGAWLCTVELPSSFTPLEIGTDYVAGLWRDDDDVEHVRLYRLLKP